MTENFIVIGSSKRLHRRWSLTDGKDSGPADLSPNPTGRRLTDEGNGALSSTEEEQSKNGSV